MSKKTPVFTGSGVALVTPFDKDGNINFAEYERLIEFQIKNGTDAIVACGTTGEASTLSDEEQVECVRFAAGVIKGRVPLIAGAGSNDTRHGASLCRACEKAGADALLLVTPYYNKATQKGLVKHFNTLANAVSAPIILYSVKARTALNIEPETALELSKTENIVAVKEASADINQIVRVASLCGESLVIYAGNDDHIVPVLSVGGVGVISVAANVAPLETHTMVEDFLNGRFEAAKNAQLKIYELVRALFAEVSPVPVKAALNLMGFDVGLCRPPLIEIEPKNLELLKNAMSEYGLRAV